MHIKCEAQQKKLFVDFFSFFPALIYAREMMRFLVRLLN